MPATSTGAGSALPTARLHTGFLIRHNSSRHILREAGQIDEGPEDEHLGTGAFPLTWSTGTGGSDRGWYRPARDLWHYWPASGWLNLRRMTPSLETFESSLAWCAFPVTDRKSTKWRQTLQAGLSP